MKMTPIYTESCFVSAGEANPEQELSLPILVAKLIDIATAHANSLGIGNPSMLDLKAGWVLSRVTIEMTSYPKVNEKYEISTWIEAFNRHFSEREFKITSETGETLGYARSIWMVMSTVDHTNVGLGQFNLSPELILEPVNPISRQAKHATIIRRDEEQESKGVLVATHDPFIYRFKYCDLDSYRHVNTIRYITLLLNRFSLEEHDNTFVRRLELSFLHEARYGMDTELLRHDSDSLTSEFLLRSKDKTPLFYSRMQRVARGRIQET